MKEVLFGIKDILIGAVDKVGQHPSFIELESAGYVFLIVLLAIFTVSVLFSNILALSIELFLRIVNRIYR
jgi:hypothetical protein